MGASLLVLKNKSDVSGCMSEDDIREVSKGASELSPSFESTYLSDSRVSRDFNWIVYAPMPGTFCPAQL